MKAVELYKRLDKDFIKDGFSDEWTMKNTSFYTDNWNETFMGLVLDNSYEIKKIYTATFPSKKIINYFMKNDVKDALLFTHHPMDWDIRKAPEVFIELSQEQIEFMKKNRMSMYTLHVPLDSNHTEYGTCITLNEALGFKMIEELECMYFGAKLGTISKVNLNSIEELKNHFSKVVGHEVSAYDYSNGKIADGKVAIVAGGGNDLDVLNAVKDKGVKVLITGITVKNEFSKSSHYFAEENGISILGGTHYSTEKFACMKMCEYFEKLGLEAEFISDEPVLEDM